MKAFMRIRGSGISSDHGVEGEESCRWVLRLVEDMIRVIEIGGVT